MNVSETGLRKAPEPASAIHRPTRPGCRVACALYAWWRRELTAALLAIAIFCGCSKSGPGKNISSPAFDSAPAETKQLWTDAMSAWKSHRYPDAAKSFVSLQTTATNLSPQQKDELTKAVDEFGQEAFTKANNGDAEATRAVQALNTASRRAGGR
jgi:hypothetical protein